MPPEAQSIHWGLLLASGYGAGLVAALLPCNLAMLPVVVGFATGQGQPPQAVLILRLSLFVLGMGLTFSTLGLLASLLGLTFGFWLGPWLFAGLGVFAIIFGLQLLEVIHFHLPNLVQRIPEELPLPHWLKALQPVVLGMLFGLVASPCGTPFLLGVLSLTAKVRNPVLGWLALFTYTLGQGTLLFVVGLFTGWLSKQVTLKQAGPWLNRISGVLFIGMGLWWILEAVQGASHAAEHMSHALTVRALAGC
jgi:cytochrome c-type biogenesis protein